MANSTITTQCCIAGGGPAGMMLGFLLARAGVHVVVLEKHADFFRDFRGDTVHPSTLELMYELGLLDEFLQLPHQKVETLTAPDRRRTPSVRGFSPSADALQIHCPDAAMGLPQFPRRAGQALPDIRPAHAGRSDRPDRGERAHCRRDRQDAGRRAHDPRRPRRRLRRTPFDRARESGLESEDYGAPMDVLWFRLSHKASDSADTFGHFEAGRIMVMLDRGDYWQCAYVIPKGGIERVKSEGLEAFRARIVEMSPFLSDRVDELKSWDDVKLLSVTVDRLQKWWRPGLICIGDAAHAMSPIGGVGINMAVQDAVAAANRLAGPLRARQVTDEDLQAIQQRRTLPVEFTQWLQLTIQRRIISRVLESHERPKPPLFLKLFGVFPLCAAFRRGCSGSAFVPSTCRRRKRRRSKASRAVFRHRSSASA